MIKRIIINYRIYFCAAIMSFANITLATDQIPEIFIYKDNPFFLNGADMGQYYPLYPLAKHEEYRIKIGINKQGEFNDNCISTGCYRGYQGKWLIKDNTLFLSKIKSGCSNERDLADLKEVFGTKYTNDGVPAFWLSDTIRLSDEPINTFTIGNNFSFLTLIIEKGRIVKITGKGPFFKPKPEYFEDKYNLASNQIPEIILFNEEPFYAKGDWDPFGYILADERYYSRMKTNEFGELELSSCQSTDCFRSYQAIWTISNDTLYLKKVNDFCTGDPLFDLEKVFGKEMLSPLGVRAFWISQGLVVSSREISEFELKAGKTPPTYLKLKINKGVVVKKEIEKG